MEKRNINNRRNTRNSTQFINFREDKSTEGSFSEVHRLKTYIKLLSRVPTPDKVYKTSVFKQILKVITFKQPRGSYVPLIIETIQTMNKQDSVLSFQANKIIDGVESLENNLESFVNKTEIEPKAPAIKPESNLEELVKSNPKILVESNPEGLVDSNPDISVENNQKILVESDHNTLSTHQNSLIVEDRLFNFKHLIDKFSNLQKRNKPNHVFKPENFVNTTQIAPIIQLNEENLNSNTNDVISERQFEFKKLLFKFNK